MKEQAAFQTPLEEPPENSPASSPESAKAVAEDGAFDIEDTILQGPIPDDDSDIFSEEEIPRKIRKDRPTIPEDIADLARKGQYEEFIIALEDYGISLSGQAELASHYMRELEDGIRMISWNERRKNFFTEIITQTLNSEKPNITSVGNMIKNFRIFQKVFKAEEGKPVRYGQFSYVMRNIFGGIESVEEMQQRIDMHKTHGERDKENKEEAEMIAEKIAMASKEVDAEMAETAKRWREIRSRKKESMREAENSKSTIWTPAYTPPRDYTFPNYTFQTGNLKGESSCRGRSTWEPMFRAFMDVVNKRLEDRINARADLSEDAKRDIINERKVALEYEPFYFPVGIRKTGEREQPIYYIPDFVDFNRWRAIEIKGPLTPEASEKIKNFQKLYVEGDFSFLPENQRIMMMGLVQKMLDEISKSCEEKGYPVFDHFSRLDVFGAYRWDKTLNNFNKYKGVEEMPGISPKLKASYKKGLYKYLEERIDDGQLPDIRTDGYIETGNLNKIIKENKGKNKEYVVKRPYSTRPYLPERIVDELFKEIGKSGQDFRTLSCIKILDTLPMSEEQKRIYLAFDRAHTFVKSVLNRDGDKFFQGAAEKTGDDFRQGRKNILVRMPISQEEMNKHFDELEFIRSYLLDLAGRGVNIGDGKYSPVKLTKWMKDLTNELKKMYDSQKNAMSIGIDFINKPRPGFYLSEMREIYQIYILGNSKALYDMRMEEVVYLTGEKYISDEQLEKDIKQKITSASAFDNVINRKEWEKILLSVVHLQIKKNNLSAKLVSPLSISLIAPGSLPLKPVSYAFSTTRLVKSDYGSYKLAAKEFAKSKKSRFKADEYEEVMNRINDYSLKIPDVSDDQMQFRDYIISQQAIVKNIADIVITNQIGPEKYDKLSAGYHDYVENIKNKYNMVTL